MPIVTAVILSMFLLTVTGKIDVVRRSLAIRALLIWPLA